MKKISETSILDNAKYITKEDNQLTVYDYIHELTHSVVATNKENIEVIAPTQEARKLAVNLVEEDIYSKGENEMYLKIGYIVEKFYFG